VRAAPYFPHLLNTRTSTIPIAAPSVPTTTSKGNRLQSMLAGRPRLGILRRSRPGSLLPKLMGDRLRAGNPKQ
jgi:hypothetical protein